MEKNILEIKNIVKTFGKTEVLKNISLNIDSGEFITFLGPSGCGKTTTLRIIAGLEEADSGVVLLENQDVTNLEPNKRNLNTVFQNYALFPHMTVGENIGYSQKIRKVPSAEIKKRVCEALSLVQLDGYEDRMPNQLSGGQSQRVAIARAVINRPKVLLLDEPLGALDLKLRHEMQIELKKLQKKLGITFIYVTHDQEEALNMSDRIVVMNKGRFEQIDTPINIYNNPKTSYVAEFIDSANIVTGIVIEERDDLVIFENDNGIGYVKKKEGQSIKNSKVTIAVRGENVSLQTEKIENHTSFEAKIIDKKFAGGSMNIFLKLTDNTNFHSYLHDINCPMNIGDEVYATWENNKAVIVDLED